MLPNLRITRVCACVRAHTRSSYVGGLFAFHALSLHVYPPFLFLPPAPLPGTRIADGPAFGKHRRIYVHEIWCPLKVRRRGFFRPNIDRRRPVNHAGCGRCARPPPARHDQRRYYVRTPSWRLYCSYDESCVFAVHTAPGWGRPGIVSRALRSPETQSNRALASSPNKIAEVRVPVVGGLVSSKVRVSLFRNIILSVFLLLLSNMFNKLTVRCEDYELL